MLVLPYRTGAGPPQKVHRHAPGVAARSDDEDLHPFCCSWCWHHRAVGEWALAQDNPAAPVSCIETRDFDRVRSAQLSREFILLTLHDGHIDEHTSEVGDWLAKKFNWDRYDFQGHGT
jgi:hypothetical protein